MRVLIVLISCAFAAAVPRCPKTFVIIDTAKASGTWYEFQRSDNNLVRDGTCTTVIFHDYDECICRRIYTDVPLAEKSLLAEIVPNGRNRYDYRFPLVDIDDQEYYIIDTDYVNYMVLMNCNRNSGVQKSVVVTRNPNPGYNIVQNIRQAFRKRHIKTPNLVAINNKDCGKF